MSATRKRPRPSRPPGWNSWKSADENPLRSNSAIASASPSAIIIVVDVVGARPIGHASGARGSRSTTSAACASVELRPAVIAISGISKRREYEMMSANSPLSPEFDRARMASSALIMPRSPWLASAE